MPLSKADHRGVPNMILQKRALSSLTLSLDGNQGS